MNHQSSKIHQFIFLLSFLVFISCSSDEEIVYPEGGYEYPKYVEDKDTTFYCYPLKDIKSTRDSFESAYIYHFFKKFDEANLSLKPQKESTFRLIYGSDTSAIIILSSRQIIVKKQARGWTYEWHDSTKLAKSERFDFDILQRFYPINDTSFKSSKKRYFDSLAKVNPKLLDAGYYKDLLDKSANWGDEKFEYGLKRISITKNVFSYLVNLINNSGYWKLPYENDCSNIPTHADVFILEANTPSKYNIVRSINCPRDSTKFTTACQEIIKYAKMDKEIRLIWDWPATTEEPIKVKELTLEELKEEPATKPKKKKVK